LNEHTWGHKTLCGSPTLAKNIDYIKRKVKKFKGFELPPHLSLKELPTIFFLARLQKLKSSWIYTFQTLLKKILTIITIDHF